MNKVMLILGVVVLVLTMAIAEEPSVLEPEAVPVVEDVDISTVDLDAEVTVSTESEAMPCEHAEYEMADSYESVPFGCYQYSNTHHRRAKKMTAVCLTCSENTMVYVDSTFIPHDFVENRDEHLSGTVHREHMRCADCSAASYIDRCCLSCPGIDRDVMEEAEDDTAEDIAE